MSATERRGSMPASTRRESVRGYGSVLERNGSVTSYTYEHEEAMTIPASVMEKRRASVKSHNGLGKIHMAESSSSLPNLVGSSAKDSIYLISPKTTFSPRKYLVAPYCFLYMAAFISTQHIFTQYIYRRLQDEMFPDVDKVNSTSECYTNKSDPSYQIQVSVQERASTWNMYYSLAAGIPAVFSSLLFGAFSDKFGRKVLLFIPLIGAAMRITILAIGIHLDLPLPYFLSGFILDGMSGYVATMLLVSFTYVADVTLPKGKQRSLFITLIELFSELGVTMVSFTTGYFIQDTGYEYPTIAAGCFIAVDLIIVTFIPESFPKDKRNPIDSACDKFSAVFSFFVGKTNRGRRWMYYTLMAIFLLTMLTTYSRTNVETLYLLDAPFCWTPEKLGYYSFTQNLVQNMLAMLLMFLLQLVMSDEAIAMFGCVSYGANFVIEGLAQNELLMYIGTAVGTIGPLIVPICRSLMSKLTLPEQQGAVFAAVAAIETVISTGGSIVGNEIYSATIGYYRGLVFFILTACNFVCLVLMGIYRFGSRRTFPVPLDIRR